jgi:hypothetical protein
VVAASGKACCRNEVHGRTIDNAIEPLSGFAVIWIGVPRVAAEAATLGWFIASLRDKDGRAGAAISDLRFHISYFIFQKANEVLEHFK